jgi:hypothetical protein
MLYYNNIGTVADAVWCVKRLAVGLHKLVAIPTISIFLLHSNF